MFDYNLPPELIAQQPVGERDQSRLLVVRRSDATLAHRTFSDLPDLLDPKDLLVLNDTRVLPARLRGVREKTSGKWEGLFLRLAPDGLWEMLSKTRGRLLAGETILVGDNLRLRLVKQLGLGHWLMNPQSEDGMVELLNRYGEIPLPCYIRDGHAEEPDRDRYQTVYARDFGAVAAPTAGLHFTQRVFDGLRQRGIAWTFITLHVGWGTFQPIQVEDYKQHQMHAEWGTLSSETVAAINACKDRGGRVVAVGTSAVRLLESAIRASKTGTLCPWSGHTDLFIYPPFAFQVVDAMVTNFHLPKTTLLLLVSALAGVDLLKQAYVEAIEQEYRFYSYGDAMLIV